MVVQDSLEEESSNRDLIEKIEFAGQMFATGHKNKIEMPGLIIATNAETVEGSTVSWETAMLEFSFHETEMWVESRMVNWWALLVSAAVAGLALVALVIGALRKQKV